MTFSEKALPYAQLGIPVFPLEPREKKPVYGLDWDAECTTDSDKINNWNAQNPDYNCGLVAMPEGVFFLEFDQGSLEREAGKLGVIVPETRVHLSGKNGKHWVFVHNDRSRQIGNRSAVANGEEWFSMRADTRYVVAPGSIHPETCKEYVILNDALPAEAPDWVLDFVERNTIKPAKSKDTVPVTDNFDFDDLINFFGISIRFTKDEFWQVCEVCPVAGHLHEQSTLTGFHWDGNSLGFNCFAASCPANTEGKNGKMTIGEVVAYLNKKNGEPYRGEIWSSDEIDFYDPRFEIEECDLDAVDALIESSQVPEAQCTDTPEEKPPAQPTDACVSEDRMNALVAEIAPPEPLPTPESLAIDAPANHEGLDFPGDCAMYGKLKEIALKHPRLQLGWLYPSLLALASTLNIEDVDHNVRSNMYVANLGEVGYGKTVCADTAVRSIFIPGSETTVMEETPSSDRGLANMLGDEKTTSRLLLSDEFRSVMQKCAIQGSALPQMICQLWSKDKAGVADKKGKQACYAKLSILGNIACKDPSEFAKLFGSNTVSGMADRFIFGFSAVFVKYRPPQVRREVFDNLKPVLIPNWVWGAKDDWADRNPETRRRLAEHALRIALVTAAAHGDREVTTKCFEAALRFMEWQERIREIYRPGLAETKEAEAYESVYSALWERLKKQVGEGLWPTGADEIARDKQEQCKLLHFAQVVNAKSYYRKYAGLIDRVRKSMADNGVIEEIREYETDDQGNEKKGKKTPFVKLRGRIR
jgi:Bifunctional DNA primase/polymerase, N-terminal